jgi:hypothetical protein
MIIAYTVLSTLMVPAFAASDTAAAQSFLHRLQGDWVGTCEQSIDGKKVCDRYFHLSVKREGENVARCKMEYFEAGQDSNGLISVGSSTVTVTMDSDGSCRSKIIGKGTAFVCNKWRNENHNIVESITVNSENELTGKGKGKISVEGLPFDAGKSGDVTSSGSAWYVKDE